MDDLILIFEEEGGLSLVLDGGDNFDLVLGESFDVPAYGGPYEFTPTREVQIAYTGGKLATQDITINPIPRNYGLVTYQGNIITIS